MTRCKPVQGALYDQGENSEDAGEGGHSRESAKAGDGSTLLTGSSRVGRGSIVVHSHSAASSDAVAEIRLGLAGRTRPLAASLVLEARTFAGTILHVLLGADRHDRKTVGVNIPLRTCWRALGDFDRSTGTSISLGLRGRGILGFEPVEISVRSDLAVFQLNQT